MNANARDGHTTGDRPALTGQNDPWAVQPNEFTRARISRELGDVLRTMPQLGDHPGVWAEWLERKADILEAIASVDRHMAAECRDLAGLARQHAAALRTRLARLDGPR